MTPAEVLSKARDILAEKGWAQGKDGICIAVAVYVACPAGIPLTPILDVVQRIADVDSLSTLYDWNDAPERTYEDVILALKRAEESLT